VAAMTRRTSGIAARRTPDRADNCKKSVNKLASGTGSRQNVASGDTGTRYAMPKRKARACPRCVPTSEQMGK
jgi:hypothetical protein